MEIGRYYKLKVNREVDFGVYLESDLGEILMPQKYVEEGVKVGDEVEVFVYKDTEDRLIATTEKPFGTLDQFVGLEVADVQDFGAFMTWGLIKDLFVPKKEQPKTYRQGDIEVVRICLDPKTDRLIGSGKIRAFLSKPTDELEEGQKVELLIYGHGELGYNAIINQKFEGLIYQNEVFEDIDIGDQKTGYIKNLREDGKIDVSLQPPGIKAIDSNSERLLTLLEVNQGFLPYTDKSAPEEITANLQMSKKAFKKAVGQLYKSRQIVLKPDGIELVSQSSG